MYRWAASAASAHGEKPDARRLISPPEIDIRATFLPTTKYTSRPATTRALAGRVVASVVTAPPFLSTFANVDSEIAPLGSREASSQYSELAPTASS